MRLRCIWTALAAGIALAAAASSAQAQTPSVLRIGIQDDPDSFDPARAYSFVGRIILTSLCNKLVDTAPDLSFVPQLALSWSTSPGGRAVTFKLRPDVTFSDRTAVGAAAVAFNLHRALHLPGSRRRGETAAIDTIDTIDPLTVRLNLKTPFAQLIAQLSDRAGLIASPKALANPAGFDTAPACSGPFKFADRVVQDRVKFGNLPVFRLIQSFLETLKVEAVDLSAYETFEDVTTDLPASSTRFTTNDACTPRLATSAQCNSRINTPGRGSNQPLEVVCPERRTPNTVYLGRALEAARRGGNVIPDASLAHLAPLG